MSDYLVFRAYNKDWKGLDIELHFRRNWKWYILAIFGYPIIAWIIYQQKIK